MFARLTWLNGPTSFEVKRKGIVETLAGHF